METPESGLKSGALYLLNHYCHNRQKIAEAYVKDDLPEHLASFVFDVVSDHNIIEAREQLDRKAGPLEDRVAKLEKEVEGATS